MKTVASAIASALDAYQRCTRDAPAWPHFAEWIPKHRARIVELCRDYLPSGSGFDGGCTLDFENSNPDKLVFFALFHHMNEGGFYDGWTDYRVTVRASLVHAFDIRIAGRDRNGIKDYIAECFDSTLSAPMGDA